jgi:hypothetical protein
MPTAARAYWKGYLKLSLVTCPVVLYPASSESEKTHFHQINRKTGNRLRQQRSMKRLAALSKERIRHAAMNSSVAATSRLNPMSWKPWRSRARERLISISLCQRRRSTNDTTRDLTTSFPTIRVAKKPSPSFGMSGPCADCVR